MLRQFAENYSVITILILGVVLAALYYLHLSKKQNTSLKLDFSILDMWHFSLAEFDAFYTCAEKSLINTKLCSNQKIQEKLDLSVNEMYHKTILIGCKAIKKEGYSISQLVKERGGEI